MYRFRTLTGPEDLATFKREYDAQVEFRSAGTIASVVAEDYLRRATHPIGCFDRKGRMVAGFVVQIDDPLIVLRAMTPEARDTFVAEVRRDELCELTAIWRNEGISATMFAALVWPVIIGRCVTAGRSTILGIGYRNPMNAIYQRVRPRTIYQGPSQTLANTTVFVYAYSRRSLCLTYVANLWARKLRPLLGGARDPGPSES